MLDQCGQLRALGFAGLSLFAAGCAATLPELRESPPQRTGPNVAIESRWQVVPLGLESIDQQAWPVIERCAGAKIDPSPPLDKPGP